MFCREHVAQLREHEQKFQDKGATLAVVGLGDAHYARSFREETGIKFPLLIDERRQAYRALGLKKANLLHLFRKDNAVARKRAKAGGHRQRKLGKDPLQLGGSFVFGPGNVDCMAHVSETFGDNATPESLLEAIR
ncbi:MAG TPA: AhpC/TSA family protein [Candidatus Angelobacter sp.]|nr:AhpC/TSA family protein [Candidatus Angelobacter sp.]